MVEGRFDDMSPLVVRFEEGLACAPPVEPTVLAAFLRAEGAWFHLTGLPDEARLAFRSAAALREVRSIVEQEQPDHVYCQLLRSAAYGRDLPVPTTLDYQDAFGEAASRHAETARPWLRPVLRTEARRVRRDEARAEFERAAGLTRNTRERAFLLDRAAESSASR